MTCKKPNLMSTYARSKRSLINNSLNGKKIKISSQIQECVRKSNISLRARSLNLYKKAQFKDQMQNKAKKKNRNSLALLLIITESKR
uniref:Uncharacterized protein n=1 Tax=Rhizophora mucronata TaxID=61149 RepID=A0A2P2P4L5_RHIMU